MNSSDMNIYTNTSQQVISFLTLKYHHAILICSI